MEESLSSSSRLIHSEKIINGWEHKISEVSMKGHRHLTIVIKLGMQGMGRLRTWSLTSISSQARVP